MEMNEKHPEKRGHELPLVVVADSNETVRMKIRYLLEAEGMHVHLADTGRRLIELIKEDKPDILLLDVNLPGIDTTRILHEIRKKEELRSILIMLLSPSGTTLHNIQGLSEGADDFMSKPFFNGLLLAKVKAMLRLKALQAELEEANRKLEVLSMTDPLTGLYNYRHLYHRLGEELSAAQRYKTPLSCISFDLDFFKTVNDSFGHQFGDMVLREFAKVLKKPTRQSDIVSRNGGEEFMIVLPRSSLEKAMPVANRVLELVREHQFKDESQCIHLTASAGITGIDGTEDLTLDELIRRVDIALYKAKRTGRNRVCTWEEGDQLLPQATEEPEDVVADSEPKSLHGEKTKIQQEIQLTSTETIQALTAALETKDVLTSKLAQKVANLVQQIGASLDLGTARTESIRTAALLHNIGHIAIRDDILKKDGPLTDGEAKILQKHPEYSVQILKCIKALTDDLPMIRHHHERFDGSGYPDGLAKEEIPIGARILSVANAYISMTSDSRYKRAMNKGLALSELTRGAGTQFDPRMVEALIAVIDSPGNKPNPNRR